MPYNGDIRSRARGWLFSQLGATETGADRLRQIDNQYVNQDAKAATIGRLDQEAEVFRYLLTLVSNDSRETA